MKPEILLELAIRTRTKGEISEKPLEVCQDDDGSIITTKFVFFHILETPPQPTLRLLPSDETE